MRSISINVNTNKGISLNEGDLVELKRIGDSIKVFTANTNEQLFELCDLKQWDYLCVCGDSGPDRVIPILNELLVAHFMQKTNGDSVLILRQVQAFDILPLRQKAQV